ncbi:MAG: hypothetical protein NTV60_02790 [Candidatus Kaiserbacteria bacterium]|nr:hypothetical protein [Candidatus Kaiserbacteria bacterium]
MERIPSALKEVGVPSKELREKATILESIHCGAVPKAELILVLSGLKPATDLHLFKNSEDPESVKKKISDAGLVYKELDKKFFHNQNMICTLGVARNIEDAERVVELMALGGGEEFGRLMGFPQTAIDAYAKRQERFDDDKQNPLFQERGLPFRFRLSKDNWEEEVKIAENWTTKIKEIAPDLYQELMSNEYLFPITEKTK